MEIETTRDIARQILRHRSFSFQEFSQRYAVANLGVEFKEARMQDTKNRQNSIKTEDTDLTQEWERRHDLTNETYQLRSEKGTQKEHQDVAIACAVEIAKIFPMIFQLI